ncbi:MAG TPA: lipid II flippase MurJ [Terracidiphilus sp.]|jgi:putative peptidoglycan lipid II flippase
MATGIAPKAGVNRRILHAATAVIAATLVVKVAAMVKEFAVAGIFGRSDAMDAFLVAFLIPNLLINLIAESMNQALVPTLIRVNIQEGHDRAQQLLSNSMLSMCVLLAVASLGMAALAHMFFPILGSNFEAGKLHLATQLFFALLPVVLITGVASTCTAVLNTIDRFALPALAPLAIPLSILAGALLFHGRFGIWALVYATLFGAVIHAGLVAWMMDASGFRLRLNWYGASESAREVSRQYGPILLSSVVASGGLLVDQAMAAMLPAGSVSALVFGNRFVSVVVTLLAGAVSTAIVPYFSTMIAHGDWQSCRRTLHTWSRLTLLASVPIAGLLIAGARPLVRMTLQHGVFGPSDTRVVTAVLAMYAIQIPFFVVSRVFYRFLVAMRRTDLILYCGVLNLLLDVSLNLILMRWLGVAGIALATSFWSMSTLLFLWYWSRRLLSFKLVEAECL